MPTQAIEQAECTTDDCDGEIERTGRALSEASADEPHITYGTRCDECGAEGKVSITEDGLRHTDELSYDEASWNNVEEDDHESDED